MAFVSVTKLPILQVCVCVAQQQTVMTASQIHVQYVRWATEQAGD